MSFSNQVFTSDLMCMYYHVIFVMAVKCRYHLSMGGQCTVHKLDDYRNKGQLVLKWITAFQRATVVMVKVGGHHPLFLFRGFIPFDEFDHSLSSSPAATLGPELGQTISEGICTPTNADTKGRKMKKKKIKEFDLFRFRLKSDGYKWDLKSH